MRIILKRGADAELNAEALAALEQIPGVQIEAQDAVHLEGRCRMPAAWLDDGRAFNGIDAIERFVATARSL